MKKILSFLFILCCILIFNVTSFLPAQAYYTRMGTRMYDFGTGAAFLWTTYETNRNASYNNGYTTVTFVGMSRSQWDDEYFGSYPTKVTHRDILLILNLNASASFGSSFSEGGNGTQITVTLSSELDVCTYEYEMISNFVEIDQAYYAYTTGFISSGQDTYAIFETEFGAYDFVNVGTATHPLGPEEVR